MRYAIERRLYEGGEWKPVLTTHGGNNPKRQRKAPLKTSSRRSAQRLVDQLNGFASGEPGYGYRWRPA